MRYAPYSKNFQDRGDIDVTNSFKDYNFSHDPDKFEDSEFSSEPLHGLSGKQEPRGFIKEHLKRTFTHLTPVNHHSEATSDGESCPSSAGSPDDSDRITLTDVKAEFQDTMLANHPCEMCAGCGTTIIDRYLLKVGNGLSWHASCLYCCMCSCSMEGDMTCYVKDDQIYCKMCYSSQYGIKCAACQRAIQSADWVRRAKNAVFHLACFACADCHRQLSTGEEFAMVDHRVVCKTHYMEMVNVSIGSGANENVSNFESKEDSKAVQPKNKRVRTTFTEEQVSILQANFNVDCNPDSQDLERLARMTGLTKRVTQVWFQNSRARQKKYSGKPLLPTKSEKTTKSGLANEQCRNCGEVYCACQMSPEFHMGRSLVHSSPSMPGSPHQSVTSP